MKDNMATALQFLIKHPNGYRDLTLRLSSNFPDDANVAKIGEILTHQKSLERLHLDLGHNGVQNEGVRALN